MTAGRRKKKRVDVEPRKVVWLIGAGASISETKGHFPSLLGLPAKARELGVLTSAIDGEPGLKHLSTYLRSRFYGDLTDPAEAINLEHVLTLLEIDLAISGDPKLSRARKYVLRLLRATLQRLHKSSPPSAGEYQHMVQQLGAFDTLITFNWDFPLDEALGRTARLTGLGGDDRAGPQFGSPSNRYDQFLFDCTGWGERTIHGIGMPAPVSSIVARGYYIKAQARLTGTTATTQVAGHTRPSSRFLARANVPFAQVVVSAPKS